VVRQLHRCGWKFPSLRATLTVLAVLAAAGETAAQEARDRLFRDAVLGSGAYYQTWSHDEKADVSELSIPLIVIWPVSKKLSLDAVSGSGFASLADDGGSLNGLIDTKVRASYILGDERALLTLGVNTPTGKTGLTGEQRAVSSSLAQGALNFRTANFGQGLDINVGLAVAGKVGELVVGAGAGYLLKGEFTPRDQGVEYKPGSELSLTVGLDRKVMDGDGVLTLDAVYTLYGDDEQEGEATFTSGNKLVLQGMGSFKMGGMNLRAHFTERLRGNSTRYVNGLASAFGNGNQLETGLQVMSGGRGKVELRVQADLKAYSANDFGKGKASLFSAGPGLRLRLGPGRSIDINVKYGTGKLDDESVSGIEAGGGIWFRL
jgi:hypothetical protein